MLLDEPRGFLEREVFQAAYTELLFNPYWGVDGELDLAGATPLEGRT